MKISASFLRSAASAALAGVAIANAVPGPAADSGRHAITCARSEAKTPVCEVRRKSEAKRPDLFHGVKAEPKTVLL